MFEAEQYQLIDFGAGRKLERFGDQWIDRPCALAGRVEQVTAAEWSRVTARYRRDAQGGSWDGAVPGPWQIGWRAVRWELRTGPQGQIGVFPEQAENWPWIDQTVRRLGGSPEVLHLFAYTGGGTLVAAAAGARVTHVDGAAAAVKWARHNADISGLGSAPIRWIVEDCLTFVQREIRRQRRYPLILLDPPSFGHGPDGQVWQWRRDLPILLHCCRQLASPSVGALLLTCHTTGVEPDQLADQLADHFCPEGIPAAARRKCLFQSELFLTARDGRRLPSGCVVRWSPLS